MMHTLKVELGSRSYPVLIGAGLLSDAASFTESLGPRSVVVTSEAVAGLHLNALRGALSGHPHEVVVLPDGEPAKSLAMVERVVDAAVRSGMGRDGTVIALGGGAIGDAAGFAAAVYHRGVGVIQAPTTLLAMVDASVGGKTAVNHPLGKNLVGAFHQPRRVVIDTATLDTLPAREFASGLAEVIKTGLLGEAGWFAWLEANMGRLAARDADAVAEAIRHCCAFKAAVVADDETEGGDRVLLNLGHSFGHALETAYGGALSHGEAVGIGCLMAAELSRELGWLEAGVVARLRALLDAAGLPVALPDPRPAPADLLALMAHDKKNADGLLRLVLLRGLGAAETCTGPPRDALEHTLHTFTGEAA